MHLRHVNITGRGLSLYLRQSLLLQRAAVVSLENYSNTSPQNIAQRHSK